MIMAIVVFWRLRLRGASVPVVASVEGGSTLESGDPPPPQGVVIVHVCPHFIEKRT